jgi:hypothetical protein
LVGPDEQHLPQMSMSNAAVVNTAAFCGANKTTQNRLAKTLPQVAAEPSLLVIAASTAP